MCQSVSQKNTVCSSATHVSITKTGKQRNDVNLMQKSCQFMYNFCPHFNVSYQLQQPGKNMVLYTMLIIHPKFFLGWLGSPALSQMCTLLSSLYFSFTSATHQLQYFLTIMHFLKIRSRKILQYFSSTRDLKYVFYLANIFTRIATGFQCSSDNVLSDLFLTLVFHNLCFFQCVILQNVIQECSYHIIAEMSV